MSESGRNVTAELDDLRAAHEDLLASTDAFFLIVIGIIIFLMQGGFALLEAGTVRTKNTVNILIKNILDVLIGGVAYWAVGWALAYGPNANGFIGLGHFFTYGMDYELYPTWFFQFVFAATTATIVSGAIAERCHFTGYFFYSVLITGIVYPPVSHWAWDSSGWLSQLGYADFAGGGVVHLLAGFCSLVACAIIGPRKGRFDTNGEPIEIPGHSVPLASLGGFILLFGFLAFNGGSQGSVSGTENSNIVARSVLATVLGGSTGGLTVLFGYKFISRPEGKWSFLLTLNGTLAGMVVQCAGCNNYHPWAAMVVGVFGGVTYLAVHFAMLKFKLDDPLDAVGVHAGAGLTGLLLAPVFAAETGIFWNGGSAAPWMTLGVNVLGGTVIIIWAVVWCLLIFLPLRFFGLYRIDEETEEMGNDLKKHGESAYPAEAWIELQYKRMSANGMNAPGVQNKAYIVDA